MSTKKKKGTSKRYKADYKLKLVRLHLEEGYSYAYLSEQTGVGKSTLAKWTKQYRDLGPDVFTNNPRKAIEKKPTLSEAPVIREKIIEIKKEYPVFGIQRISDLLKRVFFLKASPETVRKTLHEEELMPEKPRAKPKKNPQKPRFFERSKPNQMWQTDIFSFRLGGRQAYLLGYIDDYSRKIVGLGLYRSQTAENVIETYRRAVGEYGLPAEMLTDNGRQYTNWRGTTRFEKELQKDRVKHIKSQPHHPMTLGKIERFWKTIWDEFLNRCQFDSLENAQQRIALWVKYYNHRRPHQGINGLCPADRYFEIDTQLRKVMEKGIAENTLELALRGQPKEDFYMVGRMNGQSVVLEAEKGKGTMTLTVDERLDGKFPEEVKNEDSNSKENNEEDKNQENIHSGTEVSSSTGTMVLEPECNGHLPGIELKLQSVGQVADSGLQCDGRSLETEAKEGPEQSFKPGAETSETISSHRNAGVIIDKGVMNEYPGSASKAPNGCNTASSQWQDNSNAGSPTSECESQDVLRMGEQSTGRNARSFEEQTNGPSGEGIQPLHRGSREEGSGTPAPSIDAGARARNPRHSARRTSPRFRRHPLRNTKKKF